METICISSDSESPALLAWRSKTEVNNTVCMMEYTEYPYRLQSEADALYANAVTTASASSPLTTGLPAAKALNSSASVSTQGVGTISVTP